MIAAGNAAAQPAGSGTPHMPSPEQPPAAAPAPQLSIIIVTHNSAGVIGACLRSLYRSDPALVLEVIVVDNASSDGTADLVQHQFANTRVITANGNTGYAAGNNLGFAAARAPWLLMLNPDTEARAGALQAMLTAADRRPQLGMLAPRLVFADGSLQHSTFRFPNIAQAFYGFFEKLVPLNSVANGRYPAAAYEHERMVEHILGAAILVRRTLWQQTGGLDEGFALYFEETDWCRRAQLAGWQLWYTPDAVIMHIGAHATSRQPERSAVLFARSQARFFRKQYGAGWYLLLKLITVAGLLYWLARSLYAGLRQRIDGATLARRCASYWQILGS